MRRLTPPRAIGLAMGAALMVMLSAPSSAQATEVGSARPFGLGFALGSPTSIVGKYFIGGNNAIDFGLGFWSYGRRRYCRDYRGRDWDCGYRGFSINGDYLWQEPIARGRAALDWHIGAGARIDFADYYESNLAVAARMPVGLDLTFDRPNFLEVFFEIAPLLWLIPEPFFDAEAFIGLRFYF